MTKGDKDCLNNYDFYIYCRNKGILQKGIQEKEVELLFDRLNKTHDGLLNIYEISNELSYV